MFDKFGFGNRKVLRGLEAEPERNLQFCCWDGSTCVEFHVARDRDNIDVFEERISSRARSWIKERLIRER